MLWRTHFWRGYGPVVRQTAEEWFLRWEILLNMKHTEWAKSRYTEDAILYTLYLLLAHSVQRGNFGTKLFRLLTPENFFSRDILRRFYCTVKRKMLYAVCYTDNKAIRKLHVKSTRLGCAKNVATRGRERTNTQFFLKMHFEKWPPGRPQRWGNKIRMDFRVWGWEVNTTCSQFCLMTG